MTDWGNAYVITKMGAIYEQMRILLDLLENGDTTPLLIICDEWLEIRGDRRNNKSGDYAGLADDFIRLFSTKSRVWPIGRRLGTADFWAVWLT
jgi:hypothetical protein